MGGGLEALGDAVIAMWWVDDAHLAEFHEWHSREHLPERLSIPGFNRGSRWQQENSGAFFVIYELATYAILTSDAYRTRLNNPTPWSTMMMPLHRGMTRGQCRVAASNGGGVAPFMKTIRLSPRLGAESGLEDFLRGLVSLLPERTGLTGAHLLKTDTPSAAQTTEQRIRGGDAAADWVFLLSGHDLEALEEACATHLASGTLRTRGASELHCDAAFTLVHAVTPADVR